MAEELVMGQQALCIRAFIDGTAADPEAVTDEAVAAYASACGSPESLRAGFDLYRAFPQDEAFNASRREPLDVPVLLVGAEHSMGAYALRLEQGLRASGVSDVRVEMVEDSGHDVAEEQPEATARLIGEFVDEPR